MRRSAVVVLVLLAGCGGGGADRSRLETRALAACRAAEASIRGSGEASTDALVARTVQSVRQARGTVAGIEPADDARKLFRALRGTLAEQADASGKLRYRAPVALERTPLYGLDTRSDLLAGAIRSAALGSCSRLTRPLSQRLVAEHYAVELRAAVRRKHLPPAPGWTRADNVRAFLLGAGRHADALSGKATAFPLEDIPERLQGPADAYGEAFGRIGGLDGRIQHVAASSDATVSKLRRLASRFGRRYASVRRTQRALVDAVPASLRKIA